MTMLVTKAQTVLDALLASLEKATVYNRNIQLAPAVVLWSDHGRQWAPIVPALRAMLPQLLTLGEYDPAARAREEGSVKIIDLITARLDAKSDSYVATLPSLRLTQVRFDPETVRAHERMLTGGFYAEVT